MAWNTIRKAFSDDIERLDKANIRFIKRHNLSMDMKDDLLSYLKMESDTSNLYPNDYTRLYKLYKRVVSRALRHPQATGIAYGYIGYSVN